MQPSMISPFNMKGSQVYQGPFQLAMTKSQNSKGLLCLNTEGVMLMWLDVVASSLRGQKEKKQSLNLMLKQEKESLYDIHSSLAVLGGYIELHNLFIHLTPTRTWIPAAEAFRLTFCKELRDGFSGIFWPLIFLLCKLLVGRLQTLCGIWRQSTGPWGQTSKHKLFAL